jgi:hypothetical protein
VREGVFRREAGFLCLEQRLGADAAATIFLMTALGPILETLGDRGYRALQLEGGIVAGKGLPRISRIPVWSHRIDLLR